MSQTTVTNFFHTRKHKLPDQHASKKRKIVLDEYQIGNILSCDDEDGKADSSEDEFVDCKESPENISTSHEEAVIFPKDEEFKDCIENDSEIVGQFIDDAEWEAAMANAAIFASNNQKDDKSSDCKNELNEKQKEPNVICGPIVSFVVTSALGNNTLLERHCIDSNENTPTSSKKQENTRNSKKEEKEKKWTPKKVSEPLFTVGLRDSPKIIKKRLNLTDKSKNVVFQQLSSLSPQKKISSPSKVDFKALGLRLTPQKSDILSPKKPSFSKNLFSEPVHVSNSKLEGQRNSAELNQDIKRQEEKPCLNTKSTLSKAITDAKALRAKATPSEVRAKLGNVKLKDLKSRLASLSNSSLKAAEARSNTSSLPPKVPTSITLELSLPPSPSKKVPPSPLKSGYKASPRKIPAYQRYHTLSKPADRILPLPYTYKVLAEVFRCTDTVVSMLNNRQEVINADKLVKLTTDLLQKKWTLKHLRQILCVFPQAYKLAWKRIDSKLGNNNEKRELQIKPNMTYKRDLLGELDGKTEDHVKMLASHLVERRDIFRNSLLEIVKDYHEDFLGNLDPPITADRNALTKWHRDFDVDSVPDVDLADLPENPSKVNSDVMFKEIAVKASGFAMVNPKLSDVLFNVAGDRGITEEVSNKVVSFPFSPNKTERSTGLSGLNPDLIAKIKAKEAAKAKVEMMRTPEQIKRISQLKKLPELARMIRNLFITEKKAALEVLFACKRIASSLPQGSEKAVVEENLRQLTIESRGWLKIHLVGSAEYFKMDKTDINKVCEKLEQRLKDAES